MDKKSATRYDISECGDLAYQRFNTTYAGHIFQDISFIQAYSQARHIAINIATVTDLTFTRGHELRVICHLTAFHIYIYCIYV